MTLKPFTGCEYAPTPGPPGRMTAAEFVARLPKRANALHWFADFTGANARTVERWASGELDVPQWVPRMLLLHERLTEAVAWSQEHVPASDDELVWRVNALFALWVTQAREKQDGQDRFVHHIDGDPRNNDPRNLVIVDRYGNMVG